MSIESGGFDHLPITALKIFPHGTSDLLRLFNALDQISYDLRIKMITNEGFILVNPMDKTLEVMLSLDNVCIQLRNPDTNQMEYYYKKINSAESNS